MIKCPNCSAELADGTKFCANCGTAIEPAKVQTATETIVNCARCGSPLETGVSFCQACGAPVTAAVIVEETAAAQPADEAPSMVVGAAPSADTPADAAPYPLATPQGYQCPKCQAFLQPGSGFCAACGTAFPHPVPYGTARARAVNPVIPIVIALVLAGAVGFGAWWAWGRDRGDLLVTRDGGPRTFTGGSPSTTTTGSTVSEADQLKGQVVALFSDLCTGAGIRGLYSGSAHGEAFNAEYASVEEFEADFARDAPPSWDNVRGSVRDITADEPIMSGDTASVAFSYKVASSFGTETSQSGTARMIREDGTWKLDLTGSKDEVQQAIIAFMGPLMMVAAMDEGSPEPPPPPPSGGSTGEFEATTGTTGMGTTG